MDSAKVAVRQTLDQVKAFLAQESPPKLSEADTKANFIEPIIAEVTRGTIGQLVTVDAELQRMARAVRSVTMNEPPMIGVLKRARQIKSLLERVP